jgi:proline iminopeptidase
VARQAALGFADELGDPDAIAAGLDLYFSMLFYDPRHLARFRERAKVEGFRYTRAVNRAIWGDLQRFDLNPELARFRFPTLVATGRYDFNVAPSVAWAIHRAIPGSELAIFERSGHLPQVEEEDAFVARVSEFLAKPPR